MSVLLFPEIMRGNYVLVEGKINKGAQLLCFWSK